MLYWEEISTHSEALLTDFKDGCWSKPAKYFKNVKVLVSFLYLFSSGGPQRLENCSTQKI